MKPVPLPALIRAAARSVIAHSDELTALDQAIGDGDHGLNMKRGFEAVLAELDQLDSADDVAVLAAVGKTLVMKVGGASGPLYGTLFLQFGKGWPSAASAPSAASLHTCFEGAVQAVAARGKSQPGQKTMLDVLFPVVALTATGASCGAVRAEAQRAAQATIPMEAIRGRASFLKERSIGHMDPGARSSQLMIEAVCDALEKTE
jgi:dihydroxyacetone kinase-like protein